MEDSKDDSTDKGCKAAFGMSLRVAYIAAYMLGFFLVVFVCNFLHILLRPLSQPRMISEFIVGLSFTSLPFLRRRLQGEIRQTLNYIVDVGMMCHMFVIGLEIDPHIFLHLSLPEAKVGCSGVLSTFILASTVFSFIKLPEMSNFIFNLCVSIVLSGTASPLLTRIITDLKIGKSDIGKFVVSAGIHADMISIFLISFGYVLFDPYQNFIHRSVKDGLIMASTLVIEIVLAAKLTPLIMNWVNQENPEGKSMKGSHLVLSIAYFVIICSFSPVLGDFNKVLSAFIAGIFMPRDGRLAKMIVTKVNYFFTAMFFPLLFFWVGTYADLTKLQARRLDTWAKLLFFIVISMAGKVLGSVVSGIFLGFHWPESIAIGLFLNIKGHFQAYLAITATNMNLTTVSTSIVMVFSILFTIIYAPLIVAKIIERARKRSPTQRMALQLLHPSNELRILLCIRDYEHVASTINLMEISRGLAEPGILVFLTDMVELTDKVAASLSHDDGITISDPEVKKMRENIDSSLLTYMNEHDGEGIQLKRKLALATINNMHQDVCILAEDLLVSLIILPFHKQRELVDGKLNNGHSGFRHINRKILRHAPCSVGILVDRGLGSMKITRSTSSSSSSSSATTADPLNAAVIFIGGNDDREALAYAGRVARHPGVKLTVIRFLLEVNGDSVTSKISRAKANTAEHLEEMKVDDECFAEFYDRHVSGGNVAYMEKYLVNSGQTFSTLKSLEGQYEFFIVGRGGRVNSALTAGMNDWEECPELGPVGDILSASHFSVTASVLIIQQHSLKSELDGIHDEFSIM